MEYLEGYTRRWKNNIKIYLKAARSEDVDCIQLAHD